ESRRRSLPAEAVRLRRTGAPDPCTRSAGQQRPAGPAARRPELRHGSAHRHPRRPHHPADHEGAGRAGDLDERRRQRRQRRGPAGTGLGRACRPVHRDRPGRHRQAAPQTGRPAADRNRRRRGVPAVRPHWKHPSIRLRLTLVYAAVLVTTCAALLVLNYGLMYHRLYVNIHAPTPAKMAAAARAAPADPQAGEKVGRYQRDQAEIARLREDTLLSAAGTSAIGRAIIAMAGLGASWLVAGRMLRPLRSLTSATRRISHDRLHERIALTGPPDELKELADTFDEMVARLEASFNSQRRFVADASHELHTPLAIVRTGAEVLLAKRGTTISQWEAMGRRMLTATGQAERLLDGLLALARSDSGVIAHEPVDLAVAAAVAV